MGENLNETPNYKTYNEMEKKAQVGGLGLAISLVFIAGVFLIFGLIMLQGLSSTVSTGTRSAVQSVLSDTGTSTTLDPVGFSIASLSATQKNQTWLEFDGSNDWVNTSDESLFEIQSTPLTICSRFKINEVKFHSIISDRFSTNDVNWTLFFIKNDNGVELRGTNQSDESLPSGTFGDNILRYHFDWHISCMGYNSTEYYSYIDGIKSYSNTSNFVVSILNQNKTNGFTPRVGTYFDGGSSRTMNGSIDYIRIYNITLNDSEIESIYFGDYDLGTFSNTEDITLFNKINVTDNFIVENGSLDSFDNSLREQGNILFNATGNGEYIFTYTGHNGTATQDTCVGWANSSDGINWIKQGKTQDSCGEGISGDFTNATEDPYIVYNGSTYFMYAEDKEPSTFQNITLYTSTNFQNWSKIGVVLSPNKTGWGTSDVSSPVVWIENSIWHMIYEGRGGTASIGEIGYANSTNGINWTTDYIPRVVRQNGNSYNAIVSDDIYKINGIYYLLVHTSNTLKGWQGGVVTFDNLSFKVENRTTKDLNRWILNERTTLSMVGSSAFYKDGTFRIVYTFDDGDFSNVSYFASKNFNSQEISENNLIFNWKLDENQGAIAYDVSGNSNNGAISGAKWNNDGVNIALTEGTDYSLSDILLTPLTTALAWTGINASWNYNIGNNVRNSANETIVGLGSFADFWAIIVLAIVIAVVLGLLLITFGGSRTR